ncbi:LysR substrate-binding domain-containing protein [Cupriavidus oxalaticus]|uniref:LysR family transcriptional regulator n=1 Tax=Cupriavidus oxalaticus TaxID=96344 RepID=A0A4P7LM80_9BURK|nr:LysR substrate-binding domain-containing protein [Cupriavidus oxalaticus]QBY53321.1 LysR family transcriptional regulator [Cupriavidus oxalaticus]
MRLDPTSLRLFVCVAEEGSIAAAAERAHLAAAAVSKRISELEQGLGTALLRRSNKGVEPTTAGIELVHLARGVLHDLDDIVTRMRDFGGGLRGQVRVFANVSAITQFLPAQLKSFLADYPRVDVRLDERVSTAIVRAVAENAADIGIFTACAVGAELETFPYRCDELVVAVPDGHPLAARQSVSIREALDFDLVSMHAGSQIHLQLVRAASEAGLVFKPRIHVPGYDALCLMVQAGMGLGILPRSSAAPYQDTLGIRTVRLDEPWAARQLVIGVRAYDSLSAVARLLVDRLLDAA